MLELLQKFYANLPEGAKQAPAGFLLLAALLTGWKGYWVFSGPYDTAIQQCTSDKAELKAQRDEFKRIAFNSVGFLTERAQESAKINEEATKATPPKTKAKPTVAIVKVPVAPVTAQEKKAIEKPKDAEADTLNKSLDASKKVLQKTDISKAEVKKGN